VHSAQTGRRILWPLSAPVSFFCPFFGAPRLSFGVCEQIGTLRRWVKGKRDPGPSRRALELERERGYPVKQSPRVSRCKIKSLLIELRYRKANRYLHFGPRNFPFFDNAILHGESNFKTRESISFEGRVLLWSCEIDLYTGFFCK